MRRDTATPDTTPFANGVLQHFIRLPRRAVDHVHFLFAVFVAEVGFLTADYAVHFGKVVRHGPVQSDIGKRSLRTPTAGSIDAVNEAFDTLLYLVVG